MKHIYLNLKRFDVPVGLGGVNRLAPVASWGRAIVEGTQQALKQYDPAGVNFTMYLPEAHLPAAAAALCENSPVKLGCQGVYRDDTAPRRPPRPWAVKACSSATARSGPTSWASWPRQE